MYVSMVNGLTNFIFASEISAWMARTSSGSPHQVPLFEDDVDLVLLRLLIEPKLDDVKLVPDFDVTETKFPDTREASAIDSSAFWVPANVFAWPVTDAEVAVRQTDR